jgi:hypothetical protein
LRELDTRYVASPSPGSMSPVDRVASPKAHGKLLSVTPMTLMTHGYSEGVANRIVISRRLFVR